MTCHICEMIERDLNDVVRALGRRTQGQFAASRATMADLDLEIRALSATKAEIEARYWKHRKSCVALSTAGHPSQSRGF
jgi:hypothetical protein